MKKSTLEFLFESAPWKFFVIQEVHHKHKDAYDVISATMGFIGAGLEAGKRKITYEEVLNLIINVYSVLLMILKRNPKVYEIYDAGVI